MLSVIIPIYNTKKYLMQCVGSVLSQTYKDIEIILVDDGSTDGSGEECDKLSSIYPEVRAIHQENKGSIQARLLGTEKATGDYVTFVDSDDWIACNMYEEMLDKQNVEADIIVSGITRYFNQRMQYVALPIYEQDFYDKKEIKKAIFPTMIWSLSYNSCGLDPSLCTKIVKKELMLKYLRKAADLDIHYGDDAATIYPMMQEITSFSVVKKSFYFHRQRLNGELAPYIKDSLFLEKVYKFYDYMIRNMGHEFAPQIEMYYLNMLSLRKQKYTKLIERDCAYYPFDVFAIDSKFIIYGAGDYGKEVYKLYKKTNYGKLVMWVDQNYWSFNEEIVIESPEKIKSAVYDYIIIAVYSGLTAENIKKQLKQMQVAESKIIWKAEKLFEYRD